MVNTAQELVQGQVQIMALVNRHHQVQTLDQQSAQTSIQAMEQQPRITYLTDLVQLKFSVLGQTKWVLYMKTDCDNLCCVLLEKK